MLIVSYRVIQCVTICKKLEPLQRTINEAQSVPQREMVLGKMKGFAGKLPQNGTLEIMQNFILAIETAEYTRPNDLFVHTAGGGPSSPNSFEPAHSDVRVGTKKNRI